MYTYKYGTEESNTDQSCGKATKKGKQGIWSCCCSWFVFKIIWPFSSILSVATRVSRHTPHRSSWNVEQIPRHSDGSKRKWRGKNNFLKNFLRRHSPVIPTREWLLFMASVESWFTFWDQKVFFIYAVASVKIDWCFSSSQHKTCESVVQLSLYPNLMNRWDLNGLLLWTKLRLEWTHSDLSSNQLAPFIAISCFHAQPFFRGRRPLEIGAFFCSSVYFTWYLPKRFLSKSMPLGDCLHLNNKHLFSPSK